MDILIVDASIPVSAALRGLLAEVRGMSISTAASAGAAIEHISHKRPGAVIVDLGIPGGSVLDVLAHARRVSPRALVIVLSLRADEASGAACLEAGADHFLDKHSQFKEAVRLVAEFGARAAATQRKAN